MKASIYQADRDPLHRRVLSGVVAKFCEQRGNVFTLVAQPRAGDDASARVKRRQFGTEGCSHSNAQVRRNSFAGTAIVGVQRTPVIPRRENPRLS
jgi:hypothetical protein